MQVHKLQWRLWRCFCILCFYDLDNVKGAGISMKAGGSGVQGHSQLWNDRGQLGPHETLSKNKNKKRCPLDVGEGEEVF